MSELTQEKLKRELKYDPETGDFEWLRRGKGRYKDGPGSVHKQTGYIYMNVLGTKYLAHRLAWLYVHGQWPANKIDHKNCVKTDNRINNLRDVSDSVNSQNQRNPMTRNKTGLLGVSPHGAGYRAQIKVDYKSLKLGTFKTPDIAHAAYLSAKREFHKGGAL